MRKIFIILCCLAGIPAHATEMCARNDTVVIPLDATINGNSGGNNDVEKLYWVVFDYGTIYGITTCLSKKEMMMYSNWNGTGTIVQYLNISNDELIGASGYYMNADINPDIPDAEKSDYERRYCFAKLTHPMTSVWYNAGLYVIPTHTDCMRVCASYAAAQLAASDYARITHRTNVFNSIGTQPPWEEE